MNKSILILLFFLLSFLSKIYSQNLKDDCEFYKATTHLLTAINSFDDIKEESVEVSEVLPFIQQNVTKINGSFNLIKENYKDDKDFKEFELWVDVINKSYNYLSDKDSMWQMSYVLIKLNVIEFMNKKY